MTLDQQLPEFLDVLIVGGGAAGLYAALCLPETLQVGLLTKDTLALSASDWAQGGIAAAIAPDDSPELHITDTLKAGAGLCDPAAVELLVRAAPDCIRSLLTMGVAFDRQQDELALTLEAAHSRRRVLHAADTTGRAIVSQLAAQVMARPNIQVFPQTFVWDLWIDDRTGRCCGAQVAVADLIQWIAANAVILATGGGGQVYAKTTNPPASTGDGVAIARRAGATLRDLEFVQFHPTALMVPGAPHFLISEAVRGEGAHLIDATGDRFAFAYHPQGELAPRDIVSRAIFNHLQKTAAHPPDAHVWLDLRPIPPATIAHRFPNILHVCQTWGIDIFAQPIPVAPAAHYWMGGILTDLQSETAIAGLYAVGETASTGVHGANRLASNSLLECLVFGRQLQHLRRQPRPDRPTAAAPLSLTLAQLGIATPPAALALAQHLQELRQTLTELLWQGAGIVRSAATLAPALAARDTLQQQFDSLPISHTLSQLPRYVAIALPDCGDRGALLRQWGELRNLLEVSALILRCAHFRTESRGGHFRSDYPAPQPEWQTHTLVQANHIFIQS